jgi:hypothetical protein
MHLKVASKEVKFLVIQIYPFFHLFQIFIQQFKLFVLLSENKRKIKAKGIFGDLLNQIFTKLNIR